MDAPKTPHCRAVGVCRLPKGHIGICIFHPPDDAPPAIASITERDGKVVVDFGAPWSVTFTPKQAVEFGAALIRRGYRLLQQFAAVH